MRNLVILILFFGIFGFGQQNDDNPSLVYEKFSAAYKSLNADLLLDCYTKDAVLLNLYDSSDPNSIKGAENIKKYFAKFFNRVKDNGQKLELSFKITNRESVGEIIYDNGYYKLTTIINDTVKRSGYGKLSAIMEFIDGGWKFKVDSNTNTDESEYINARGGSIPQPKAQ